MIHPWLEEFYSIEAGLLIGDPDTELVKHAIKKWNGAREENLDKHDVHIADRNEIWSTDEPIIIFDTDTCALCQVYFSVWSETCGECPLYRYLGARCFDRADGPYTTFLNTQNPEPMIRALEGTLKMLEEE